MIDTMTIKLNLNLWSYNHLFEQVNSVLMTHGHGKLYKDKNKSKRYLTTKFSSIGFWELAFHKGKFKQYLEIKLQPARLLAMNECADLCRAEDYLFVESAFNQFWNNVLDFRTSEYMKLENWKVSRIDYAFQFQTSYLKTYLDLLHRGQLAYYLTQREYDTSFYATGNAVNINFYDKHAQLKNKSYLNDTDIANLENLLRFEVQCKSDYLHKLKKKFSLSSMTVKNFWDVDIARHVLSYRIKMLVGKDDFYRLDVAQRILRERMRKNSFILNSIIKFINQTSNLRLAKEIFYQNYHWVSRGKWDKLLWKLRQFRINPITFSDTAEDSPTVLKNPCSLLAEDFQRSHFKPRASLTR